MIKLRIVVVVEGPTELRFVKRIVSPHLIQHQVDPYPVTIGRQRRAKGSGGRVTIERLANDMAKCYKSAAAVTSLVDFYGFSGKGSLSVTELEASLLVAVKERIGTNRWDRRRVHPYVQMHEFEALLYSRAAAFGVLPFAKPHIIDQLREMRLKYDSPEDINDSPISAPSKRIESLMGNYKKASHGIEVAAEIGLEKMPAECHGLDPWIRCLEGLGRELSSQ